MTHSDRLPGRSSRAIATAALLLATTAAAPLWAQTAVTDPEEIFEFETADGDVVVLDTIVVQAASQELRQAPGSSVITAEDLQSRPVSNDLSEAVRRMPGVNLTGNATTGQRGNNRQIDLRGMGPENTLILIDGRPVLSRNSVRMGRSGERDTRGDSNWVPAEAVERIEVVRGPAAARYGSGASGGVVNIITKQPERATTTVSIYGEAKENDAEGATYRANVVSMGPVTDRVGYRTILGFNRTQADALDINADATEDGANQAAGREGITNIDLSQLFDFRVDGMHRVGVELSYSHQANEYAGDALFQDTSAAEDYYGTNTNTMQRTVLALTHEGSYDFGDSFSYIQLEHTNNRRNSEGLAGGGEGLINSSETTTTLMNNLTAKSEWNLPSQLFGLNQTLTFGGEYRGEFLEDAQAVSQSLCVSGSCIDVPGVPTQPEGRDTKLSSHLLALYAEDNIELLPNLTITPGLRADWHSEAGLNLSPSVNASWEATPNVTIKGGLSRAFKAPNLYQLTEGYVYKTRGRGCPVDYDSTTYPDRDGCYILGNADLEHENSWNLELGASYQDDAGRVAGLTYFRNDYRNKIQAGDEALLGAPTTGGGTAYVFQWVNIPRALVEGLEANLRLPLGERLTWTTNATSMIRSQNLENGQPLSLVPEYTINASLDYEIRENWSVTLSATHYGETASPTVSGTGGGEITNPKPRDPYTLIDLNSTYEFQNDLSVTLGVKNLADTRIYREGTTNSAGANTYNEPGRTFSVLLSKTF